MKFENAIEKIKGDKSLTEKFMKNPQEVLSSLDVDLTGIVYGSEAEAKIEGVQLKSNWSGCVSVGKIVCASVGHNW